MLCRRCSLLLRANPAWPGGEARMRKQSPSGRNNPSLLEFVSSSELSRTEWQARGPTHRGTGYAAIGALGFGPFGQFIRMSVPLSAGFLTERFFASLRMTSDTRWSARGAAHRRASHAAIAVLALKNLTAQSVFMVDLDDFSQSSPKLQP